jgi:cellobiose-specific phosphotransferase system component IIB
MLEKMENMTKELRKRDTLLEEAEVRAKEAEKLAEQLFQVDVQTTWPHSSKLAPAVSQVHSNNDLDIAPITPITPLPLCNSPPLPYNNLGDDDMYMGDSKSDGQKERRYRKAAKKREKRQQREKNSNDSDITIKSVEDRMVKQGVDCDDNNSDNESYKWKRKAVKKG